MVNTPRTEARRYTEFVAVALEAERGASRLSVEELANRSGVPERTLYRVLHAQRDIGVGQVRDIAAVFGLNPSDIFADAERRMARDTPTTGVPSQDALLNGIEEPGENRTVTGEAGDTSLHPHKSPIRGSKGSRAR